MQEIRKQLKLNKQEYYLTHLAIINCILPRVMTPKELEIVAAFMSLEGDIAEYRFGPTGKKVVMKLLGLSPAGLSNHLKSLLLKGFLLQVGDVTSILPLLIPESKEQLYIFKLVNNEEPIQKKEESN